MLHDSILGVELLLRQFQNFFAWWMKWKNLDSLDHYYLGKQIFLCEQIFLCWAVYFYVNKFVGQFFFFFYVEQILCEQIFCTSFVHIFCTNGLLNKKNCLFLLEILNRLIYWYWACKPNFLLLKKQFFFLIFQTNQTDRKKPAPL